MAEQSVVDILMPDAPPAQQQQDKPAEAPAADSSAAEGADAAESQKPEKPAAKEPEQAQPGTPDKVLQRMQQDLSAATRKLDELAAKAEGGQALSAKEQQQAQAAARKLDAVRAALAERDPKKRFDPVDHGELIAESLLEQDETLQGLSKELRQTRAELAHLRQSAAAAESAASWAEAQRDYPGIDIRGVWEKCVEEAAATIGEDNPGVRNLASKWFHERARVAAKSVAAKAAAGNGQTAAAKAAAKGPTPGSAKVTVGAGVAPPSTNGGSPEDRAMRDYMALVVDEN